MVIVQREQVMRDSRVVRSMKALAVCVAAVGVFAAHGAQAQGLGGVVTLLDEAGTLIMPFDNTTNHASFQIVTRVGPGTGGGTPVATHWSYWSEDCRHLVDVLVCLTPLDTKVMDPSKVQGEIQSPNPPSNNGIGSITDLTGERGLVIVTAFEANTGASGLECNIIDPESFLLTEIFGGWIIADTSTNAAFGADALGLPPDELPEASTLVVDGGVMIPTFNPQSLGASTVITFGLEVPAGNGLFTDSEPGPINRDQADGSHVCCNVSFTDDLEITTSLPDLCFECVDFRAISGAQAAAGEASIIPPNTTIDSSGFVTLRNCSSAVEEGGPSGPLGDEFEQFVFAIHGQAVGPFGVALYGTYTSERL